jgi:hypothetical protein
MLLFLLFLFTLENFIYYEALWRLKLHVLQARILCTSACSFLNLCTVLKSYPCILDIPVLQFLLCEGRDSPMFLLHTKVVLRLGAKSTKHGLQWRRHIPKPNYCFKTDFTLIDHSRSQIAHTCFCTKTLLEPDNILVACVASIHTYLSYCCLFSFCLCNCVVPTYLCIYAFVQVP